MNGMWICLLAQCLDGPAAANKVAGAHQAVALSTAGLRFELPSGWVYASKSHLAWASHDGPMLNEIAVSEVAAKSAFEAIHRPSNPDMSPEDLADNYVADFNARAGGPGESKLVSSEPAQVAGRPGFMVHFRYRAADGLGGTVMEEVTYGLATRQGLVTATFRAPSLHYFQAGLPAFEATLRSMSWR